MKIILASDHAGYALKNHMADFLRKRGIEPADAGTFSEESCDYPDYAAAACKRVASGEFDFALLFCGTGLGMSIAANKLNGVRCAVCSDTLSAKMARAHNDANALALGARVAGYGLAEELVTAFLETKFDTENPNHGRRVEKIRAYER